jgi:hypothetical protein
VVDGGGGSIGDTDPPSLSDQKCRKCSFRNLIFPIFPGDMPLQSRDGSRIFLEGVHVDKQNWGPLGGALRRFDSIFLLYTIPSGPLRGVLTPCTPPLDPPLQNMLHACATRELWAPLWTFIDPLHLRISFFLSFEICRNQKSPKPSVFLWVEV